MSTPFTVNYPGSVDDAVSLGEVSNNAETTLSASLSNVAVTASITDTSLFPSTGAFSVNSEIIYYTGKTSNSFTGLIRGRDGTTAAAHASGDAVAGNIIARHHSVLAEALIATQAELDANTAAEFTQGDADALYSVLAHVHTFASLTSKPTTISGYGIVDAFTQTAADALYSALGHTHSFASLTSKPTTISGFGITDAYTKTEVDTLIDSVLTQAEADALYSALGHTHTFASLTSKPTTIAGYGITDFNSLGDARWAALSHTHAASDVTSGVFAAARIATGTPDGTKFLRDDQVWSTVSASDATKLPLAGGTMTGTLIIDRSLGAGASLTQSWRNSSTVLAEMTSNSARNRSLLRVARVYGDGINSDSFDLDEAVGLGLASNRFIKWSSTSTVGTSPDVGLYRNAAGVLEVNSTTAGTFRDLKLRDLIATAALNVQGAAASVASGISIGGATRTTIGANGAASALTALPLGYLDFYVGSTAIAIPFYNRGA